MVIRNKIESVNIINKLNLNHFPEKVFRKGETEEVSKFIEQFPAEYYAIRDKSKTGGFSSHKIKREEVLEKIKIYNGLFSINVSSINYTENQVLVGEIQITKSNIYFLASTNKEHSLRDAYENPNFNLNTTIFDRTLNKIPYFDKVYEFIIKHNLKNIIVEFAYFNKPVGINKENIIIYELRTDY